jgi:glutamate racemase
LSGPILVFDSGIGGLSVLAEIRNKLPQHDYCYLFDNARLPYGNLEDEVLIKACVGLICQHVQKIQASIVVVACNTASTLVLPILRKSLSIPVVGVVPAIKPAAQLSRRKHIGVLATPGTVSRDYTQALIKQFALDCQVDLFGSSELVLLAEQKAAKQVIDKAAIERVLQPIKASELDVLVLGCTHFPMLKAEISDYLGSGVTLVDSGEAIASRVTALLTAEKQNHALPLSSSSKQGQLTASYTLAISEGLKETLRDYGVSQLNFSPLLAAAL